MILLKYRLELVSTLSVIIGNKYTFYLVPGPVSTLISLMSDTWAVISWSVPSYIPVDYPIITYEIGYITHQSNDCSYSPSDEFIPMIKTNECSRNMTISDLMDNICYLFGVHGYTVNGYEVWTVITNQTLIDPSLSIESILSTSTSILTSTSSLIINTSTTELTLATPTSDPTQNSSTTQTTVSTNEGKIILMCIGLLFVIEPNN